MRWGLRNTGSIYGFVRRGEACRMSAPEPDCRRVSWGPRQSRHFTAASSAGLPSTTSRTRRSASPPERMAERVPASSHRSGGMASRAGHGLHRCSSPVPRLRLTRYEGLRGRARRCGPRSASGGRTSPIACVMIARSTPNQQAGRSCVAPWRRCTRSTNTDQRSRSRRATANHARPGRDRRGAVPVPTARGHREGPLCVRQPRPGPARSPRPRWAPCCACPRPPA